MNYRDTGAQLYLIRALTKVTTLSAKKFFYFFLGVSAFLLFSACSIPNLEKPECTAARDVVKRFYSFHFGNDMRPSPENLEIRKAYLSPNLFRKLSETSDISQDYFTASEDFPRAFRVGVCKQTSADSVAMQVLLFWKDDRTSEQNELNVNVIKSGNTWLIDEITNK